MVQSLSSSAVAAAFGVFSFVLPFFSFRFLFCLYSLSFVLFLGALNFFGKGRAEGKGDPQRAARGRWTGYGFVSSAAMIYTGRTRCINK